MSTQASAVSDASATRVCRNKFTHPGHGEAFLNNSNPAGRADMEEIKPMKGKIFVCDKPVDDAGNHVDSSKQHGARVKGSGTSADKPQKGEQVESVYWE